VPAVLVLAGELFSGIVEKTDAEVVTEPDTEFEAVEDESSNFGYLGWCYNRRIQCKGSTKQ
jgi:hypothetical protein